MDFRRKIVSLLRLCIVGGVGFVLGFFYFVHYSKQPTPNPTTDTLYREKIVPYKVEVAKFVEIPKAYFMTFSDTLQVPIEKVVYKEKEFEATISGASIGGIKPTLEHITIYDKKRLFTPYASLTLGKDIFGLGGGVTIQEKHGIGIEYLNLGGKSAIGYKYTYNF